MKISVVVPCFNAVGKIDRCLRSLEAQTLGHEYFEVVFVDDCSTDETADYLRDACARHHNWRVTVLEQNSGSPSRPRNVGVSQAVGDYVFYLDCDDELFPDSLERYRDFVLTTGADVVRGYLIADDGVERKEMNRLQGFAPQASKMERVREIISRQSTTVCQLIRTSLLRQNKVEWPESLRMGEDTLFLVDVLVAAEKVEYLDHPTFIYHKARVGEASSTQTYGARELGNHLFVWNEAERRLAGVGLSYLELRLRIGLQAALLSLTRHYTHDISPELFGKFAGFVRENWELIGRFSYSARLKAILAEVFQGSYDGFLREIRPHLLVAGFDLKFIRGVLPALEKFYAIRVDEWSGHATHDEKTSRSHLEWAEIIFCEWLLGNAVWYSENKRADQRLVVRVHRFELATPWCEKIDHRKVDRFIAVSLYYVEKVIERVGCPRGKVALIPNFIDASAYLRDGGENRVFSLAMIGILPRKKGYLHGLQVLKSLADTDTRYTLTVFGKRPEEVDWVVRSKDEMEYYNACARYIEDNGLQGRVRFTGWVDVSKSIKDYGFVLSMSEKDELFESFHIAPADGFAGGGVGVLTRWNGVEYIYPDEFIVDDVSGVVESIRRLSKYEDFIEKASIGRRFIEERYSISEFCGALRKVLS